MKSVFDYCFKRSKNIQKDYRFMMYYMQMWEILMNQFEYKGLPETLPAEWIEGILASNGTCGIGEKNGKLYATAGSYKGNLNGYLPEEYVGVIPMKGNIDGDALSSGEYDVKGIPNKTIVVAWNNTSMTPELELFDIASALCEGRTSEDINVIFSRLLRIPVVKDSKAKTVVESAIKAILEGKIEAVASSLKFDELLEQGNQLEFLDLADVKDVDKLQYLNQYMDNVLKRFMRRHGFSLNITNKLAQQTNAEMHGADDFSMIYPLIQLKYRKKFIDDLNKIFGEKYGFNASVEFSELLKNNYDKILNYVPDELNEKGIIEGVKEGVKDESKTGSNSDDSGKSDSE